MGRLGGWCEILAADGGEPLVGGFVRWRNRASEDLQCCHWCPMSWFQTWKHAAVEPLDVSQASAWMLATFRQNTINHNS